MNSQQAGIDIALVIAKLLTLLVFCLLLVDVSTAQNREARSTVHFVKDVAPILIRHCVDCHNVSDLKGGLNLTTEHTLQVGGESGPVISPNALDDSLIWTYVAEDQMPPRDQKLTTEEKNIIRKWLVDGARWEGGPIDPLAGTTERRAGRDWWSLQPLRAVSVPVVKHDELVSNDIDKFILAKLLPDCLASST